MPDKTMTISFTAGYPFTKALMQNFKT